MTWYKVDGNKIEHISINPVGLTFLKTPTHGDLEWGAVAPWDSFLLGTKEGDFVKVGHRYLPIYLHDECVLLEMDEDKENKAVELSALICYRVDCKGMPCNESQDAKGLEYCKSSTLADRDDNSVAPWGSLIWGIEEKDFVKVGRHYLPKHVNGELALVLDVKTEEPNKNVSDMVSHLQGEIANMQSESKRFKDDVTLQLNQQQEEIQELLTHLNETTQRVGAFESCLRKLSGLVVLCKDFEARLATHEEKLAGQKEPTPVNHSDLHAFDDIPEGEEDVDSPKAGSIGDQSAQRHSTSYESNANGFDAAKMWQDIQSQFQDFESKLDNHTHNLPDFKEITQTFDSRMETLEKQLYDLADTQLRQQRLAEAEHTEVRLLFSQLQVDTTKEQCELQQVQQLEEVLGVLKSWPDKCISLSSASHHQEEPCLANEKKQLKDVACSKSAPGTPLSLKATRQVLSAAAVKPPRANSPNPFQWQPRPGSRSVQVPSRDFAEAAVPKIVLSSGLHPSAGSISPRIRSLSPPPPPLSARQLQQANQQSLLNENNLGGLGTSTRSMSPSPPSSARQPQPNENKLGGPGTSTGNVSPRPPLSLPLSARQPQPNENKLGGGLGTSTRSVSPTPPPLAWQSWPNENKLGGLGNSTRSVSPPPPSSAWPPQLNENKLGGLGTSTRSISPSPPLSARQPQQVNQQSLLNENKLGGAPQVKRPATAVRSSLTAVPVPRNPLSVRAASPGSHRMHRPPSQQGAQQGFKGEMGASAAVSHLPAPQFISGRSTIPVTSAYLSPRQQMNIGGA